MKHGNFKLAELINVTDPHTYRLLNLYKYFTEKCKDGN